MKFLYLILFSIAFFVLTAVIGYFIFKRIFPRDKAPAKTLAGFYKAMTKRGNGHIAQRVQKDAAWFDENEFEEVTTKSFDGLTLYGRLYRCAQHNGRTIIMLHGYRSSAANDFGSICPFLMSLGYNILAVDQRAHGKSEGEFTTLAVAERFDATEWAKWVENELGSDEAVVLYGASMGATAVVLACAEDELPQNVIGAIADSAYIGPYMQLTTMMRKRHVPVNPFLNIIDIFCMSKGRFTIRDCTTTNAAPYCQVPMLFIHGGADALVGSDDSRITHEQCASRSQLLIVPDAEHTRAFITDEELCRETISAFLESLSGPPSPERILRETDKSAEDEEYEDEEYEDDDYEEDEDRDEDEDEDEYEDEDEEEDEEYTDGE